ncbi:hypothetical protein DPQ33_08165 [Oceanidesulfovibrio indonesiensis]|uniref:phosphoglycolate phosphatase n=1 Tax=Oceanidesulfovibrio indonesiensis TaxID=54767 RepID=A0A7M3MFT0_9BACT|nr:HAD family hydrolase [Oceanidesulfovibrio indonesiensis]TVM17608.1 hypothetical protein DPQ33_08165 [Oceanidesulfovibrio indonesiensis]
MSRYDLICLDYDGTLMHSVPAIAAALGEVFTEFGLEPPAEDVVRAAVGMGIRETFLQLHPGFGEEQLEQGIVRYRAVYSAHEQTKSRLFPRVLETMKELAARGHRMTVVSNKGRQVLEESVARLGLAEYVDLVVGDRPGYAKKPDARVWDEDVSPAFPGIAPERVLMVGDAYPDMAFARAVGMAACFATWGYGDRAACLELGPRHVIDAFDELVEIFE